MKSSGWKKLTEKINYFKYRLKWNYGKYLPLKKPVCIDLELASICNLKCDFCYHSSKTKFKKDIMSIDIALEAIQQAAENNIPSIKFNYRGESTLNDKIPIILNYAEWFSHVYKCFIDRIINTNLNIKHKDRLKSLLLCNTIKVSIDSLDKKVYEKIRPGGNHDLLINNITFLHDNLEDQRLILQFVRCGLNNNEDFLLAQQKWPKAEIVIKDVVGGRNEKTTCPIGDRIPCLQAFTRLMILYNGDMQICCPDINHNIHLGNIKETSIIKAFNSKKAKKVREGLKDGTSFSLMPCKGCSSFESYKGYKGNWNS